ncbi:hypothetical protein HK414_24010 [Ramlibacter terrae]|uniref:Ankyrin repeat domain-containing protein n=1 Tax=Ramlibacter terrae TaxID=2732511 RepID=A0ABX6P5H5_9BURK|nr:hypothetical protein HK414_24010 [Ramlibacter terrae]
MTDANTAFGPIFEAAHAGDNLRALELLLGASGQSADYFNRQPDRAKALQIDNARTLPELLLRQTPPPDITCEQLSAPEVPTCVGYGAASRPLYAVVARAAQRCLKPTGTWWCLQPITCGRQTIPWGLRRR